MRVLYTTVTPPPVYPDGTEQPRRRDPWPQSGASVAKHAPGAEKVVIGHGDWRGYWEAVAARWGKEDLMLVEQDIILHPYAVTAMESCPRAWCLFPYHHPGSDGLLKRGLGCTRFRLEFQHRVPLAALALVDGNCPRCDGAPDKHKCWAHLDGRIAAVAESAGFTPHVHSPAVGHRDVLPEGEQ